MDKQSCENSIMVLKKVRGVCSSRLDTGALAELDGVIFELETAMKRSHGAEEVAKLSLRVLQGMAVFVSIVTNISDWMK